VIETINEIIRQAADRLGSHVVATLPALLAAIVILLGAFLIAAAVRWVLLRAFKGFAADQFLVQSGLSSTLGRFGRLRASRLVASAAYWLILVVGILTAVSVFDTKLSGQIVEAGVLLVPKLITAAIILILGAWLSQYLGRSALVWSVNEELPAPRRIAAAVRVAAMFAAVVVAAYQLNFAANVFFAAFIIVVGGAVLTAALAFGLGARGAVGRYLENRREQERREASEPIWKHL
jgi:hypothetical protein